MGRNWHGPILLWAVMTRNRPIGFQPRLWRACTQDTIKTNDNKSDNNNNNNNSDNNNNNNNNNNSNNNNNCHRRDIYI